LIGYQYRWDDWQAWHSTMSKFFAENFIYSYSYPNEIDPNPCTLCHLDIKGTSMTLKPGDAPYHGIKSWWSGEHIPWNLAFPKTKFAVVTGFILAANEKYVTILTYAKSHFSSDFKGIPQRATEAKAKELGISPGDPYPVTIVDQDFYLVDYDENSGEKRILINWCDGDLYGIIVQSGRVLLDHVDLPQGIWYPPRTMEGIPAPFPEFVDHAKTREADAVVASLFNSIFLGYDFDSKDVFSKDAVFYFNPYGIGFADSPENIVNMVLKPVIWDSLSNRKIQFDAIFCESYICGAHGNIIGTHVSPFLGVPHEETTVKLRFGAHLLLVKDDGILKIKDGYCLFDLIGAAYQMGRNLVAEAQEMM